MVAPLDVYTNTMGVALSNEEKHHRHQRRHHHAQNRHHRHHRSTGHIFDPNQAEVCILWDQHKNFCSSVLLKPWSSIYNSVQFRYYKIKYVNTVDTVEMNILQTRFVIVFAVVTWAWPTRHRFRRWCTIWCFQHAVFW